MLRDAAHVNQLHEEHRLTPARYKPAAHFHGITASHAVKLYVSLHTGLPTCLPNPPTRHRLAPSTHNYGTNSN
jgi:hypothetical protein